MRKYFLIATAIFILDRLLKILSATLPGKIFLLPGLAFDYHLNRGIIFSLDVPLWPVEIASVIFMAAIFVLVLRAYFHRAALSFFGWFLILLGAVSNFYDRVVFDGTVDYVNILDTSLVNLADGMIIAGIIILIFKMRSRIKKEG